MLVHSMDKLLPPKKSTSHRHGKWQTHTVDIGIDLDQEKRKAHHERRRGGLHEYTSQHLQSTHHALYACRLTAAVMSCKTISLVVWWNITTKQELWDDVLRSCLMTGIVSFDKKSTPSLEWPQSTFKVTVGYYLKEHRHFNSVSVVY